MIRYYGWAAGLKLLGILPGGKAFYRRVGRTVKRGSQGTGPQLATAFSVARQGKALIPSGGTVLDVGTGWFHHDAFLLYAIGDYQIHLFDVEDRAELGYIRNYLRYLTDHADMVARGLGVDAEQVRARLGPLLELPSRAAIYDRCGFRPSVTNRTSEPWLPERSVDFMVSNCVLVHIRPEELVPELVALRRMLTDEGAMCHMLGHDDHWAFHDPAMAWPSFQYLRYSERTYRWLFDTKLEYHNRIVKPEWPAIFARAGLRVEAWDAVVTDESRRSVRDLPHIDARYACHSVDDLAVIYSYVLLRKERLDRRCSPSPSS